METAKVQVVAARNVGPDEHTRPPIAVGVSRGLGFPGMGNASVAIYALHPWEIELGTEGSLGHNGYTARVGPALHLMDGRNEAGQGVTMYAPMLVGYRAPPHRCAAPSGA